MPRHRPNTLALLAALVYLVIGALWIAISDDIAATSSASVEELTAAQTLKGWGYIASTALLTFLIVRALLLRDRRLRQSGARLRAVFAHTPVGIALTDTRGRCVLTNPAFDRILGLPTSQISERPLGQLFGLAGPLGDPPHTSGPREIAHRKPDGSTLTLRLELIDLQGLAPEGRPEATTLVIAEDITPQRDRDARMRLDAVTFESLQPTLITDPHGVIVRINQAYLQMTGHQPDEVIGQTPRVFSSGKHDLAFYKLFWEALRTRGRWEGEMVNRRADGTHFPVWQTINAVKDAEGQTLHYVADVTDLSERRTFERELHRLEHFDPLTNLPNRRHLITVLGERTPAEAEAPQESVLLLDLDAFRRINDALGPSRSDALLREVARILTELQPDTRCLARVSADAFALVLPALLDDPDLHGTITDLRERLAAIPATLGSDFPLTASIGATCLSLDPSEREGGPVAILAHAETALHHAKLQGAGSFRVYDPTMQSAAEARLALAADLKRAIAQGEIVPYFQPLRDLRGQIVGAEALARWVKGDGQLISPAEFIPLAEELGFIGNLGEVILGHVARLAARLSAEGAPINLSVNVSAQHMRDPSFVERALAIVMEAGADAKQITLEVTESLVIGDYATAAQRLATLQSHGFRIAIDDFGTGYSSLSYLRELPIDELKIDGSFLRGAVGDPRGERLFESVVSIGRTLGLMIVAEGVETEAHAALATRDPEVLLQGYLFGRPAPEADFLQVFCESRRNGKSRTDLRLAAVMALIDESTPQAATPKG